MTDEESDGGGVGRRVAAIDPDVDRRGMGEQPLAAPAPGGDPTAVGQMMVRFGVIRTAGHDGAVGHKFHTVEWLVAGRVDGEA